MPRLKFHKDYQKIENLIRKFLIIASNQNTSTEKRKIKMFQKINDFKIDFEALYKKDKDELHEININMEWDNKTKFRVICHYSNEGFEGHPKIIIDKYEDDSYTYFMRISPECDLSKLTVNNEGEIMDVKKILKNTYNHLKTSAKAKNIATDRMGLRCFEIMYHEKPEKERIKEFIMQRERLINFFKCYFRTKETGQRGLFCCSKDLVDNMRDILRIIRMDYWDYLYYAPELMLNPHSMSIGFFNKPAWEVKLLENKRPLAKLFSILY